MTSNNDQTTTTTHERIRVQAHEYTIPVLTSEQQAARIALLDQTNTDDGFTTITQTWNDNEIATYHTLHDCMLQTLCDDVNEQTIARLLVVDTFDPAIHLDNLIARLQRIRTMIPDNEQ